LDIGPGVKVVRATLEVEGDLAREEDVSEDTCLVGRAHTAFGGRDWPENCTLSLINVPAILQDGTKVRIRKKLQTGKIESLCLPNLGLPLPVCQLKG
jgi:hypothetical protein